MTAPTAMDLRFTAPILRTILKGLGRLDQTPELTALKMSLTAALWEIEDREESRQPCARCGRPVFYMDSATRWVHVTSTGGRIRGCRAMANDDDPWGDSELPRHWMAQGTFEE